MNDKSIRLNKFISDSGYCSRREADKLIEAGAVKLNGQQQEPGSPVHPKDEVIVQGQRIRPKKAKETMYIAYNKPEGITCTTETSVKGNIIDAIKFPVKIFPIGRLDKFSQGLIFLTNDGDIVNKILRAGNSHEKEYIVSVDRPINNDFIRKMSKGVPILDTVTQACKVTQEGKFTFRIVLTQGLNRQIRRMCEYLGYRVQVLQRTRIMNVSLANLTPGNWRHLTAAEMDEINQSIAESSKTKEASKDRNKGQTPKARPKKDFKPKDKRSHDQDRRGSKDKRKKTETRAKSRSQAGPKKRDTRGNSKTQHSTKKPRRR